MTNELSKNKPPKMHVSEYARTVTRARAQFTRPESGRKADYRAQAARHIANHAAESEKALERYLVELVRKHGGQCLKYANSQQTGYPDRLILLPGGRTAWAEIKSRGKHPTRLQCIRIDELRQLGYRADVVDSREAARQLLAGLLSNPTNQQS